MSRRVPRIAKVALLGATLLVTACGPKIESSCRITYPIPFCIDWYGDGDASMTIPSWCESSVGGIVSSPDPCPSAGKTASCTVQCPGGATYRENYYAPDVGEPLPDGTCMPYNDSECVGPSVVTHYDH